MKNVTAYHGHNNNQCLRDVCIEHENAHKHWQQNQIGNKGTAVDYVKAKILL